MTPEILTIVGKMELSRREFQEEDARLAISVNTPQQDQWDEAESITEHAHLRPWVDGLGHGRWADAE